MLTTSRRPTGCRDPVLTSGRTDTAGDGDSGIRGRNGVVVSITSRQGGRTATVAPTDAQRSMWTDRRVLDARGEPLGVTVAVIADPATERPVWLAVYTGVAGATVVVVPAHGSSLLGDDIVIDAGRDTVLAAPPIELRASVGPTQERVLSDHFRRGLCVLTHPSGRQDDAWR